MPLNIVTLTRKFEITFPAEVIKNLNLKPGQKMLVSAKPRLLVLTPLQS